MPDLKDYGLACNNYHLHLNVDYEFGDSGWSASSPTGMNCERYGQFRFDADAVGLSELRTAGMQIKHKF